MASDKQTPLDQAIGSTFNVWRSPKEQGGDYRLEDGWILSGFRWEKLLMKKDDLEKEVACSSFWAANWNNPNMTDALRDYFHNTPLILNEPVTLSDGQVISGAVRYSGIKYSWWEMIDAFFSKAYPIDIPFILTKYADELKEQTQFNDWLQNIHDNFVFLKPDWDDDDKITTAVKTYLNQLA